MAFPAIRFRPRSGAGRRDERGAATVEYGLIVALVGDADRRRRCGHGHRARGDVRARLPDLNNVSGVACTRGNGRGNNGNGLGNGGSNGGGNPGGGNPGGGSPGGGSPGGGGGGPGGGGGAGGP